MASISKNFFLVALIYLILGLFSQAVTVFDLWLGFNPLAYTAVTITSQLLLIGWLTQLGLALVYDRWAAPKQPPDSATPANATLPMVVLLLFNIGLPLILIGQPGLIIFGGRWLGALAALGGLLLLLAGLVFGYDMRRVFKQL